jgi:hypothetical protein
MGNQMRWRTRTSIGERELRDLFGDRLLLGKKKVLMSSDAANNGGRVKRQVGNAELNSPAIIISASDSRSRSPGVPLRKMFTSPTMGRVGISVVANSPSDVLARIINVNSGCMISLRVLGVPISQNEERTYYPRPAAIFLRLVYDRVGRNEKSHLYLTLHSVFLFKRKRFAGSQFPQNLILHPFVVCLSSKGV